MAIIVPIKRKNGAVSYRAMVRVRGIERTKTFRKQVLAKDWAADQESSIRKHTGKPGAMRTIGALMAVHREQILEQKPYSNQSNIKNAMRLERHTADALCGEANAAYWVKLAQRWTCSPSSRLRYFMLIKGALRKAERLEGVQAIDWDEFRKAMETCRDLHLTADGQHRDRRPTEKELAAICSLADSSPTLQVPLTRMIHFAIDSCLRAAEQGRLTWGDYDATPGHEMMWVRNRKHPRKKMGNDWHIPMLGRCPQIVADQKKLFTGRRDADPIFPYNMFSVAEAFDRATARLGIVDLTWHDLRHEGISRLFEQGYQIQEVALVSGHGDWKSLKRYTNLTPKSLHKGPAARRTSAK